MILLASFDEIVAHLRGARICVLSGAGISTESGIPDYRGPGTLARARNPITFQNFVADAEGRKRYWARSAIGWPRLRDREPNAGHIALAQLEQAGALSGIITQNVDRLHHRAGSETIVELHGALADVVCLGCGARSSREDHQRRLLEKNPGWDREGAAHAPDGDADVDEDRITNFHVVDCTDCGGSLKPKVVFFGESVPAETLERAWSLFDASDVLLVVGSSLTVYSGFRFVRKAHQIGKPVLIINLSETRGDELAAAICREATGSVLPRLAATLP